MESVMNASDLYKVAEVELVYKTKVKASERPKIGHSGDAYKILLQCWDLGKIELMEQFKILLLNRASKVLGISEISTGGYSGTIADPKLIFAAALKGKASSIILCHNHPSGNLKPSEFDKQLTKKIVEAGYFLDIKVFDHIIVSPEAYYSFANEGLL